MKKHHYLSVILFNLFISLYAISCSCNAPILIRQDEGEKPTIETELPKQSGILNIEIAPISLLDDKKTTEVSFTTAGGSNPVDLNQFKLQIELIKTGGTGSSIIYMDSTNKSKKVISTFQESVSHFCPGTELKADSPVKVTFTLAPDPIVTSMEVKFKLLDKNDKLLKEITVNWKKTPTDAAQLKFAKLAYDKESGIVTYTIQNIGSEEAKDVQLCYTNISISEIGKTVLINNQKTTTINLGSIPPQGSTNEQTLVINFKKANQAKFSFEISHKYQDRLVKDLIKEEEFRAKLPLLRLTPLSPTKLIGANKTFQFKVEEVIDSDELDSSKLKLIITDNSGGAGTIKYNDKEHNKINELFELSEIELGEIIKFSINSSIGSKLSYTLQLNYEGKDVGDSQTAIWEIDAETATKELLKAISTNNNNDIKILELLEVPGIDINIQDEDGYSPLHLAVDLNREVVVKALLAKGANVNTINDAEATPLHTAIRKGSPALIENLLNVEDIDINVRDNNGNTPLYLAVLEEKQKAIEILVAKGANATIKNNYRYTPLYLAITKKSPQIIGAVLAAKDINVHAKDSDDQTLLHQSTGRGGMVAKFIIETLVFKGADVNAINIDGETPLHLAAMGGETSVLAIETLIAKGAHVNVMDKKGDTPLHIAIEGGVVGIIKTLLNHGAKLDIENKNKKTPLDLAQESTKVEIKQLFGIIAS